MQKLNSRRQITKEFAAILRIIGHPDRIRILEELSCEEKDVKSLLQSLDLPGPRVSQHLSLLRAYRIVDERRAGRHHVYRIVQPALVQWITRGLDVMELQSAKVVNSSLGKIP